MWKKLLTYKSQESQCLLKIIAVLEMVGGPIGIINAAHTIFFKVFNGSANFASSIVGFFIGLFALLMFSLVTYSGYCLWKNMAKGYRLSIISQAIQIPFIYTSLFHYVLGLTPAIYLVVGKWFIVLNPNFFSSFSIGFLSGSPFIVGFNILALIILIYLVRFWRKNEYILRRL